MMKVNERVLAITLAVGLAASPATIFAENVKEKGIELTNQEEETQAEYVEFKGSIKSLNLKDGKGSIWVVGEDQELIFHVNENVLVDDLRPSKENKLMHLKEGAELVVFYEKNTPMAMSNPGQLTPRAIIVKNSNDFVKLDRFDENLVSSDGQLRLNLENKEKYQNQVLLVQYNITTESLPAQTSPKMVTIIASPKIEPREEAPKEAGDYIKWDGQIKSVDLDGKKGQVLVTTDQGDYLLNINEEVLVDDLRLTKENKLMNLKEGAKVIVYIHKSTPILTSMPAQVTPRALIVNNNTELEVKLDRFDGDLVSSDGQLKLNLEDGESYKNKELLVFYKETTKSIPAQTKPEMVLDLSLSKVEPRKINEDKVIIDGKEVSVDLIRYGEVVTLPLREVAEALGYKVEWQGRENPIEVSKGAQFTSLSLDKNSYHFAKMAAFELELAPRLVNSKTYVPVTFFERVLQLETSINDAGVLVIK